MKYDLEERTIMLSKSALTVLKKIPPSPMNNRLIDQSIGSITAIGANYREAIESESRKDFIHKLMISKKEIKESLYWLELLIHSQNMIADDCRRLRKEVHELLLIFSKIISTAKKNGK